MNVFFASIPDNSCLETQALFTDFHPETIKKFAFFEILLQKICKFGKKIRHFFTSKIHQNPEDFRKYLR